MDRLIAAALLLVSAKGFAEEPKRIAPRTPDESLKQFEAHPSFRVELAAAEPLVMSPVAAEFDEDGRLFVAEAPEYNAYGSEKPHGKGRVVMLEDADGDGKFDRRTVLVEHLDYPTALFPWDGGLYIGAAPNLYYWKDGKLTTVLTGFGNDKAGEGQINSFRWGLDNRIHISTGSDGGDIRRIGPDIDEMPVSVRRQNVLLDPRRNTFDIISGGGQHGMSMDDWGNTFVCGNSDPCMYLAYDTRLLKNAPTLAAPPPAVSIAPEGKFTKLHRISEVEPWRIMRTKLRKDGSIPGSDEGGQPSGFFTGATGITIYRGDAYPDEFRGNAFVGEVANNLVYRAKLVPKGTSFVAERADEGREFLASKDVWFRPVQFLHGPDGCLYVIDMYRELIEGAAFLAPPVLKLVDPSAGVDKGRIWRIVPKSFNDETKTSQIKARRTAKLGAATASELVKLLNHPDGWQRDTAARLLYQKNDPQVIEHIRAVAHGGKSAVGRVHALSLLQRLGAMELRDLRVCLSDKDLRLRAAGLRIAGDAGVELPEVVINDLIAVSDAHVRYELLSYLTARETDQFSELAKRVIKEDLADPAIRLALAAASLSGDDPGRMDFFEDPNLLQSPGGRALVETIVDAAGAQRNRFAAIRAVRGISRMREREVGFQFHLCGILLRRCPPENLERLRTSKTTGSFFAQVKERASEVVRDMSQSERERVSALNALAICSYEELEDIFGFAFKPNQPKGFQVAALELLWRIGPSEAAAMVFKAWPSFSPPVRATATEVLLSRPAWVQQFLDAIEAKKVARGDVDLARVALLRKSPNRAVRLQVEKLFTQETASERKAVLEKYQQALTQKGDPVLGKAVFKTNCAACHKLEGVGEEVGADLKAIRDRGSENTLLNILDPNREVKPQFLAYQLETTAGKTFSGMLTAETPNGVTIRLLDGRNETISRTEIESLRSTGLSFMPEGLEKQIDPKQMADLLAYLNSIK